VPLPELVDYDALLFAPALAVRGGAVRPVVDELLAVANDPDRLHGIDPTLARVRAADLLSLEHDPALLDAAVAILREAVSLALPGEVGIAQDALAKTLAEQGNVVELDALACGLLREPPSLTGAHQLSGVGTIATMFGYGGQAAGWLDQALTAAAGGRGRSDQVIRDLLSDCTKRLARIRGMMTADGYDPDDPAAARARMWTRPTAAASVSTYPPWPAGYEGRLVWWPEPDYLRLIRQLPEVATVLGDPWRGHTAKVQAAMTGEAGLPAGADRAARPQFLVAADVSQFGQFLEWARADPLAPATMTAFGALADKAPDPARWPPRDRAPCWCGSGARYRDCCGRPARPG
jgi:SEC-C motif